LAAIQKPINAEGLAIGGQHACRRDLAVDTTRHWTVFAHVRITAG
jgi:hypothetical protein